jgi:hypothetical protein
MYKKEKLFYNPLLDADDIVIEKYGDDINSADFDKPKPTELITGLLGQASIPDSTIGKTIKDLDNLLYDGDLP